MYYQLAWRNLWRNPRRTLIILTAIVIGISSMVVLAALSRGTMEGMLDNTLQNLVGHIRLLNPDNRVDPSIENRLTEPDTIINSITPVLPPGTGIAKRIKVDGMLSTSREHVGISLVGIEPSTESGVSFIGKGVTSGRMFDKDESNSLVIGKSLLEKINGKLGRKVVLMSQNHEGENVSRAFRIRGVFQTELAATEKTYVFAPLAAIQDMLGVQDGVTEISLVFEQQPGQRADLAPLVTKLNQRIKKHNIIALDWRQMLPAMSAYLEMYNGYMLIWYIIVFIAMGFGLVNTMLMAVYERMREFGLLRAMGMRSSRIIRMVIGELLLLLAIGVLVANGAALVILKVWLQSGIDLTVFAQGTELWGIDRIIVPLLTWWDILSANAVVVVLGLLVGLYPALRAARFTPIETMRHI